MLGKIYCDRFHFSKICILSTNCTGQHIHFLAVLGGIDGISQSGIRYAIDLSHRADQILAVGQIPAVLQFAVVLRGAIAAIILGVSRPIIAAVKPEGT